MTKVGIIGASGMAGSAIYKLASQNPTLQVTGIVRNEAKAHRVLGDDANLVIGNVLTMTDSMFKNFDVIVDAFGTIPAQAGDQLILARKLIDLARKNKIRVIFILGAGSLRTGEDHHLVVKDIAQMPGAKDWINVPEQQVKELDYLNGIDDVDWLGISPSLTYEAGPATAYEVGGDDLLYDENGESKVTNGTMAKLVVSEILHPEHSKERITVVNKE